MNRFFLLVDNSTKPEVLYKYGKSAICWSIFKDKLNSDPLRIGLLFCNYNVGPNEAFYMGIIKALEDCEEFIFNSSIIVLGDCQLVIQQLNKQWQAIKLKIYYDQVKAIETKYKLKNKAREIIFKYINNEDRYYKQIDRLAKDAHNVIKQRIRFD